MTMERKWITPLIRQSFVSAGLAVNVAQFGLVLGLTATLLPELRQPDSTIQIGDQSEAFIASIPLVAVFFTNFTIPTVMGYWGRWYASLACSIPVLIGWMTVITAQSAYIIIFGRFIQGISLSYIQCTTMVLIAEYTSPRNRGIFSSITTVTMGLGTLMGHTTGAYLSWQSCGLISAFVAFVSLIITLYSPESPSWLIDKGRYCEGRKVFRWLRGDKEDDELEKMIDANKYLTRLKPGKSDSSVKLLKINLNYLRESFKKKEFYKPILIMVNLMNIIQFSAVNVWASYAVDLCQIIAGNHVNNSLVIFSVDTQRIITSFTAIYVIKKLKRKTMLALTTGLNILAFLTTAGYCYGKTIGIIPDLASLGIFLCHLHLFSIGFGSTSVPYIIGGEIVPLEYRSVATTLSYSFQSPLSFAILQTVPFLLKHIGLHGMYCIYAGVMFCSVVTACIYVPETKDRTLQDIEDEFRGREAVCDEDIEVVQALKS